MENTTQQNGTEIEALEKAVTAEKPIEASAKQTTKARIAKLLEALNDGVFEKEEAIRLSLLTSIAGESIFFLGQPGVAKSLIARRLKFAFKDAKSFEYLMNRFSTPDEVFGPISVPELTNRKYIRLTEGYLPEAEIVFLDEIWKAGPAIQNTLLTVLNEKKFRNGQKEEDVKLKGLISASNELPSENDGHGDSVEALWDRFLMRLVVKSVEDEGNFNSMISDDLKPTVDNVKDELKISDEEYKKWDKEIDAVTIPEEVYKVIDVIRKKIQLVNDKIEEDDRQYYISDRRWRKIVRILRTSAFLNDRKEVDLMDCFLIKDCIWNDETEIETVREIVAESIRNYGYNLTIDISSIDEQIKKIKREVKEETTTYKKVSANVPAEHNEKNKVFYKVSTPNPEQNILQYISKADFATLAAQDKTIYFYDLKNNKTVERTYVQKGDSAYSIKVDVMGDNKYVEFTLEQEMIDEATTKKPNRHTLNGWNNDVASIIKEIEKSISIIDTHRKEKLPHLQSNIFVDSNKASIVEENLHVSIQNLTDLKIEIEKVKYHYDGLE